MRILVFGKERRGCHGSRERGNWEVLVGGAQSGRSSGQRGRHGAWRPLFGENEKENESLMKLQKHETERIFALG